MPIDQGVAYSIHYLSSENASARMETNPYWPKWDSPWWHMSVLFEMGLAKQIPKVAAEKLLAEVKRTHLPYFFRAEAPATKAKDQDGPCPCALGNIYQVLRATGVAVDDALPWARSWFLRYQMPDGGLNCDEDAYRADPDASSIVATIAPLEAVLFRSQELSDAEKGFLDRGAQCLLRRELRLGSASKYNADEKHDEGDWLKLCFPRFYFYDVLRGLSFILKWAEARNRSIPESAITTVVDHLRSSYPDGQIRMERQSFEEAFTWVISHTGEFQKREPASHFPLLDEVSAVGSVSPYLTAEWAEAEARMDRLRSRGLLHSLKN